MSDFLLQNDLFRLVFCNLAGGSEECVAAGYSAGLLPASLDWLAYLIAGTAVGLLIANAVLIGTLGLIWGERRLLGRFQSRTGPNRWGPFGLLTPVADAIKLLFKEDIVPADARRMAFNLAPIVSLAGVLMVFAFIPFGVGLFVVDLNVGLVFLLGVTSLSALSILLAGWASGNRISIFSSMRAVAVLISYEIPAALSIVGIILITGSLSLGSIVEAQHVPFLLVQPLAFLVFAITALAEAGRTPFDVTEAESELGAGHLNDYSGMKFGLLYVTEFMAEIAAAAVITTLFLSGWRGFGLLPDVAWFLLKMSLVLFAIVWFRASWPRLRVDQVLQLAWKGLFELTLVNIVVTAVLVYIFPSPSAGELWIMAAVNWVVFFVTLFVVDRLHKRNARRPGNRRQEQPPYPVAPAEEVAG